MSFFKFFAERHLLAYVITFLIILLGIGSMLNIKRDAFPSVEFGELLITTVYPGASPEDVELMVTNEIEEEIKEVTGIKRYMSWSMENVSSIHIVIDPDVDDENKVIREIREAVSRVTDLPEEVTESPLVTELSTSSFPMIEIGLAGDLPYSELREIAKRFQRKLENVDGVSSVDRYGYRAREVQVEVDPRKLDKADVSLAAVVKAIGQRNIRATGGSFESYTSEKNIVTLSQFRKPGEVGDVIVRTTFDGPSVKVRDLAVVVDGFEEEKVLSRVNGRKAISFVAFKTDNADIVRTVDAIKKLVVSEQEYMPSSVEIMLSNDESKYVKDRLSIVANNGIIGLSFVMIVLAVFLSFRVAFWVALGIPVALLGTIFMLPIFDGFLDSITMTAMVLVLGIIVDDAIIIAESIYQRYEQGMSAISAAVAGVCDVIKPVITTILTTFVVFLPMFFMPGMLGKFVVVIPLVITLALVVSLIESTLALPAHIAAGMKPHNGPTRRQEYFDKLRHLYTAVLSRLLPIRYVLVVIFVAVLGGALTYAEKYMDFVLFPSSTAERFMVLIETPVGTSLKATSDRARDVEKLISGLGKSELDSYVTRIGTFGDIGSSERENNAAVFVSLTPFADRQRIADEIVESLREQTDKLNGVERIFYMIDSGGPPVGRPITLRVVGIDDGERTRLVNDIVAYINTLEGTKDIDRDDKEGKSQVEIKFDYDKLARIGISVEDVARNVRIAYDGEVVTSVRYGDEDVDFRAIFTKNVRKNPQSLSEMTLPNRNGYLTPLKEVARFVTSPGPANFTHYKGDRAVTITGDIDKDVTTPLKVSQAVLAKFNIERDYPGMALHVGGEAEESQKSVDELIIIMGIACIGIYLLLTLLFNSVWQPFMVMTAIPFALVGVIVGFSIHNEALGFLGMIGVIGLAGVVVNDSLVLVAHVNELRKRDPDRSLRDIVAEGTSNRLRAVLLTTVSTVAGLLPLAYGIGGADPYMGPMALALGWGLLFATPLTLLLLPCLYMIGEDISRLFKRKSKI
ncbi:MAG: efflux RND transporter permease subunit [Gammaproteobacteria bacterium]